MMMMITTSKHINHNLLIHIFIQIHWSDPIRYTAVKLNLHSHEAS